MNLGEPKKGGTRERGAKTDKNNDYGNERDMKQYERKYTDGKVVPYSKNGNQPKWRASISETTFTETQDENGNTKVVGKRKVRRKTFQTIDCTPYASGKLKGQHHGKREAEKALQQWRDELIAQAHADYEAAKASAEERERAKRLTYANMPFGDYVDMVLEERAADGIEASTLDGYRRNVRYAKDFFANKLVGEIAEDDIVAFNRKLFETGISDTTRRNRLIVLKMCLDAHKRHIGTNPFEGFRMPTANATRPNPLDEGSLKKLRKALKKSDHGPFMTAVELALRTGMRQGEVCGLRWGDVDMATGTITVCNAIGRSKELGLYEKRPKDTKRGNTNTTRTIPGSPKILSLLKARQRVLAQEIKHSLGDNSPLTKNDLELVSPSMYVVGDSAGRFMDPDMLGRNWRGFSQGLTGTGKRRVRFHDLRHTFATQMIASGMDVMVVAKILGHDPSITLRVYADAMPKAMQAAMLTMDEVL